MKRFFILAALIFFGGPVLGNAQTAYYVNPEAGADGNGSFEKPWNSINQVNAHKFKDGDSLYFKVGTTLDMNQRLIVSWHGGEENRVIIGAYHGKNLFGLGGASRPVLDGSNWAPSTDHQGLVHYSGTGYVTIQDLHVRNSPLIGIKVFHPPGDRTVHNIVRNCMVIDSGRQGISFERSSYGLIENNIVSGTSLSKVMTAQGVPKYAGASIEIGAHGNENFSLNNVVRGNTISRGSESLGIYKGARHTIVEYNVIYDFVGVGIYAANARNGIIRHNLVYQVGDEYASIHPRFPQGRSQSGRRPMIHIDCEGHVSEIIKVTGDWKIYDNFIAGGKVGIALSLRTNETNVYQENNKIFNNRIVDCDENFQFNGSNENWRNNEIIGNYSFILTPGLVHTRLMSPYGVSWNSNFFNTKINSVIENGSLNNRIDEVSLKKDSGWRNLAPGDITRSSFDIIYDVQANVVDRVSNFAIIKDVTQ